MSRPPHAPTALESPAGEAPPAVEHRCTTNADPQIHYVRTGPATSSSQESGSALMLVHGLPQSWRAWRAVARLLADDHTILMPDLHGFGDSARPLTGYGTTRGGQDLMAVLDHSGTDRVTLAERDLHGRFVRIEEITRVLDETEVIPPAPTRR